MRGDPAPADAPAFPGTLRITSTLDTNSQRCTVPSGSASHSMSATSATNNRMKVGLRAGNVTALVRYVALYRF